MLLTAFTINSLPLNNYVWEFADLGGNAPFKLEATVSTGYQDISSIEKFDEYGLTVGVVSVIRTEIDGLFQATTWAALTTPEKKVVSKWFLTTKTNRDTVHNAIEQQDNAQLLAGLLNGEKVTNTANNIKDAEPSDVTNTVNASSSASTAPECLDLNRKSATGNQTGIVTGTDIIMDESRGNGIAYNSTTGVATLKANKTYRLFATFAFFSIESADTIAIDWVFDSDNLPIYPAHETRIRPANAGSNGSNASTIEVVYIPTVDTDVKMRCTEYTHATDTVTMYWERSMATIIEIR